MTAAESRREIATLEIELNRTRKAALEAISLFPAHRWSELSEATQQWWSENRGMMNKGDKP